MTKRAATSLGSVRRVIRFGSVGLAATGIHAGTYAVAIEAFHANPFLANFLGYAVAVLASFVGHRNWTFRDRGLSPLRHSATQFLQFVATSVVSLGLNSLAVLCVVVVAELDPLIAIVPMLFLVPAVTFLLMNQWIFKAGSD